MELNQEKRKAMDSPVEWFDRSLVEKRVRFAPPPQKAYKTACYMPITHISIDFLPFHDYDIHERQVIDSWRK